MAKQVGNFERKKVCIEINFSLKNKTNIYKILGPTEANGIFFNPPRQTG